jgi:putative ferrous iron transport protein C
MILAELKAYIEQNGSVSRSHLAKRFALSEDGVDAMLDVWIKKGKISRFIDTNAAGYTTRVRYSLNQPDSLSLVVKM